MYDLLLQQTTTVGKYDKFSAKIPINLNKPQMFFMARPMTIITCKFQLKSLLANHRVLCLISH